MQISQEGVDFIKKWEGLKLSAYLDTANIWTIGYGHINAVQQGDVITEDAAENFLRQDLQTAEFNVNKYLGHLLLNQNQYDAFVSLVFNLGHYNIFVKQYNNGYVSGSSLFNLMLEGNFIEASEKFKDFVKSGGVYTQGLMNRRIAEFDMFLSKKKGICQQCGQLLAV